MTARDPDFISQLKNMVAVGGAVWSSELAVIDVLGINAPGILAQQSTAAIAFRRARLRPRYRGGDRITACPAELGKRDEDR